MKRKTTMKDVAKAASVSTATVSRVLNNNYPVSKEVIEKVLKAMDDLQYKPNLVARSLRINKSNLVAIVVADIRNPYYASIAREIDNYLFNEGYNLIICSTDESSEKEKKILDMLIKKNVDAIAISPCNKEIENITQIINKDIYTVLLDREIPQLKLPYVGGRNFEESYLLTEYLIKSGHRKIAIMTGNLNTSTGEERFLGYQKAMSDYHLSIHNNLILSGDFMEKKAFHSMCEFFSKQKMHEPLAIVSCNNLMTEGIMKAAMKFNIKIPENLSIVSFGAIENEELIRPKITCIKQSVIEIGKRVADLIYNKLNSHEEINEHQIIENTFVEGSSVKVLER